MPRENTDLKDQLRPSPWARQQADIAADDPNRIMRLPETARMLGVTPQTIWRMECDGRFPRREKIDPSLGKYGAVGHRRGTVIDWLEARVK